MKSKFISQRPRQRTNVKYSFDNTKDVILRPSTRYEDLQRSRITDGVTSSTGLFDEAEADVPEIFNPEYDKFDLANSLISKGLTKQANEVVSKDLSSTN